MVSLWRQVVNVASEACKCLSTPPFSHLPESDSQKAVSPQQCACAVPLLTVTRSRTPSGVAITGSPTDDSDVNARNTVTGGGSSVVATDSDGSMREVVVPRRLGAARSHSGREPQGKP